MSRSRFLGDVQIRSFLALVLATSVLPVGCTNPSSQESEVPGTVKTQGEVTATEVDHETLTQLSTIQVLLEGGFFGWTDLSAIHEHGDFGLGTFTHLDGEMVQLGDAIYQVKADGSVHTPDNSIGTPFFVTTFFNADLSVPVTDQVDFQGLQAALTKHLPSPNYIYAIQIEGSFEYVMTRSVPPQQQPYPTLATVAADQPTFEFKNVHGTLVGFYFPEAFGQLNVPGFHFHFLTEDRSGGGHVLEFSASGLQAELDQTAHFELMLPQAEEYAEFVVDATSEGDLQGTER